MKPASRVKTMVSWCFETQPAHESLSIDETGKIFPPSLRWRDL